MELTDEQIETLIENSDGHWREDTFRIDGPSLTALLRAAAKAASADVSRDAVLEEAALIADRRSYGPDDREAGAAAGIADEIRALKRQSNSPRSDKT